MRERPVSRWLDRTNVLVGIAVGVITVLGSIVALVTRGGASPTAVDRYRTKLQATRSHFVAARDRLQQLSPPASLRVDWTGSIAGLDNLIKFWDDLKANTQTLSSSELTVFTYPSASWQARLTAAEASLEAHLGRLMGRGCQAGRLLPS
jgi:hypothetical protein